MRTARATIGSLGAGLSLAIAASVALLTVSSVIAFNGWPGAPSEPSISNVARLTDSGRPTASTGGSAAAATLSLPAAAAVLHTSAAARRHRVSHHVAVNGVRAASTTSTSVTSTSAAADTSPASAGGGGGAHKSAGSQAIADTGTQAGNTVRQTTHTVGQAVAPVAPQVVGTLEQIGAAGGDTVQQAGDTASKLVP